MKLQELRQQGLSISEISRTLHLDRKTVCQRLQQTPRRYQRRERSRKRNAYAAYWRERWEGALAKTTNLGYRVYRCPGCRQPFNEHTGTPPGA